MKSEYTLHDNVSINFSRDSINMTICKDQITKIFLPIKFNIVT